MGSAARATDPAPSAARLRPGERPRWWDASRDGHRFDAWRAAAADHGVGVDPAIAATIEFALVCLDLADVSTEPEALLRSALRVERSSVTRIGGPPAWTRWLGATAPYAHDELPELVLPQRLAARLTPGHSLDNLIQLENLGLALDCDRHAAVYGRTLESWALTVGLRAVTHQPRSD